MDNLKNISHRSLWLIVIALGLIVISLLAVIFFGHSNSGTRNPQEYGPATSPDDVIMVTSPAKNVYIADPALVTGVAGGSWAKGTILVQVFSGDGKLLGQAPAQLGTSTSDGTKGVGFQAVVPYGRPAPGQNGSLVFSVNNSSGAPLNYSYPVKFQ